MAFIEYIRTGETYPKDARTIKETWGGLVLTAEAAAQKDYEAGLRTFPVTFELFKQGQSLGRVSVGKYESVHFIGHAIAE